MDRVTRAESASGHAAPINVARRSSEILRWLIFIAVMMGGWEIGARLYGSPFLLPAPSSIFTELGKAPGVFWSNFLVTTQEIVVGFVLGSATALLAATALLGVPAWLEDFIFKAVSTLNSIPFVALASLVVVWIGVNGIGSKVAIAGLYAFFALVYHSHQSMKGTERMKEELLISYGANFGQRLWLLKFPASLPVVMVSLKGAAMAAVNGAIVGELFGAFQGLGFMILDSRYVGNTSRVFLAALGCAVVGWVLLALLGALEARVVRWHFESTRQR